MEIYYIFLLLINLQFYNLFYVFTSINGVLSADYLKNMTVASSYNKKNPSKSEKALNIFGNLCIKSLVYDLSKHTNL